MNIIDTNKYVEFKNILSGCRTILDAYYFAELYIKKNPEMKGLVYSMINGKRYDNALDFKTMKSILDSLNDCEYMDSAREIIDMYTSKNIDNTQIRSLLKISANKPIRPPNKIDNEKVISVVSNDKPNLITRPCPHCSHLCSVDPGSEYVICGYTNMKVGYDWKGCGKDWCFLCGKILCKTWDTNELFLEMNRYHDSECCKNHSRENFRKYPEEYCSCQSKHVNRYIKDI